jgi:putative phosphoribosyl transferase
MTDYGRVNCAVLAISLGGLIVGAEIARKTHSSLFLLPVEEVLDPMLPRGHRKLSDMQTDSVFNSYELPDVSLEELDAEFHAVMDKLQLKDFLGSSSVIGKDGELSKALLKRHSVIIASDGLSSGLSLDIAAEYLKPIAISKVIVAAPICSADITEKVRGIAGDSYFLDVVQSEYPINHYYEENDLPDESECLQIMSNISLKW